MATPDTLQNQDGFKSQFGFIMAAVGSCVGMANVWGFPNKLGSNGGGAFLVAYLFFICLFSYVGLPAEFAIVLCCVALGMKIAF